MVRYWLRTRRPGWRWSALLNGIGAATTLVVTVIVIATKFLAGAWMVIVAIPLMIAVFYAVRRHYRAVARRLRAKAHAVLARREVENTVLLYVERLDAAAQEALWYARTISGGSFRAVHVPFPGSDTGIGPRFFGWTDGEPRLEILSPQEDEPLDAMLEYVWRFPKGDNNFVTVVVPELFRKPSLLAAVRRSTFRLSSASCASRTSRSRTCRGSQATATSSPSRRGRHASFRSRASTQPRCAPFSTRSRSASARRRRSPSPSTTGTRRRSGGTGRGSRPVCRSRSRRRRTETSASRF
jgi:hypothetical protein